MEYIILNTALLVCIFVLADCIRRKIKFKFNKQYNNIKDGFSTKTNTSSLVAKYFSVVDIEKKLVKCGNPLRLTANTYMLVKILLAILLCSVGFSYVGVTLLGFIVSALAAILGFFLVDILNYLSNQDDKNKIRLDLADVYDLIAIQTVAGVSIGHALLEAHSVCRNKRFKKSLVRLAAKINLSKNIERALDEFNEEYDMHEIDAFVAVIKESVSSGVSDETLDDQSSALKTINAFYTEAQTEKIDMHILIISMLLLGGIMCIIYYCIGSNLMQGAHAIFR